MEVLTADGDNAELLAKLCQIVAELRRAALDMVITALLLGDAQEPVRKIDFEARLLDPGTILFVFSASGLVRQLGPRRRTGAGCGASARRPEDRPGRRRPQAQQEGEGCEASQEAGLSCRRPPVRTSMVPEAVCELARHHLFYVHMLSTPGQ